MDDRLPRRILITGSTGFIGKAVTEAAAQYGEVWEAALDFDEPGPRRFKLDVSEADDVHRIVSIAAPQWVIHLGGVIYADEVTSMRVNARGTEAVCDAIMRSMPSARLVCMGSAAEYGIYSTGPTPETQPCDPQNPYGRSKNEATKAVQVWSAKGMLGCVARPFNVVGTGVPDKTLFGSAIRQLKAGQDTVKIGSLTAVRDFISLGDLVEGLFRILERGRSGEIYNLCSGFGTPASKCMDILRMVSQRQFDVVEDESIVRQGEADVVMGDPSKARIELAWSASEPLEQAVLQAWNSL